MSKWREYHLSEFFLFGNGKIRPSQHGLIPIYGGNGVLGFANQSNYDGETIIIGRVGAYCGSVFFEDRNIWVSDNALSAKPKSNYDTKFLYYLLNYINLNQYAEGSSHPLITQKLLNSINIFTTDDQIEQKAIAGVLSSLDDKIDLLHRQNKTLEAMAETLFRQWFIEEAEDDWEEYQIKDFIQHIKISVQPQNSQQLLFTHFSIPSFDNNQKAQVEFGKEIKSNKYKVIENTILVSKLNPMTPRVWAVMNLHSPNSICSTEFQVLQPLDSNHFGFFFYLLKSNDVVSELGMAASGTSGSHQRITATDILNINFSVPNMTKINSFSQLVRGNLHKIDKNRESIKTLERFRDLLLPKLMSGEVRVEF